MSNKLLISQLYEAADSAVQFTILTWKGMTFYQAYLINIASLQNSRTWINAKGDTEKRGEETWGGGATRRSEN